MAQSVIDSAKRLHSPAKFLGDNYNSIYSKNKNKFYWGIKPYKLVTDSAKLLPNSSKVLDLGCGEGKNSFYLAKMGFGINSVDVSGVGIKKLQDFAEKEGLMIEAQVSDAGLFLNNCENFDAVFCINMLQFIKQKNRIIKKMKSRTSHHGLNVIASFAAENEKKKKMALAKGRYLFDTGELKERYKDWKILFYEEKLGKWETHGKTRHRHLTIRMIAQKP
ncbi:MAG: methyltransferase domain-containing protein [Candidatus Micrarchaeota archaeon]|nr:methyltransferase domain-containing protein [Candidatus Micrarchaeota archaeon]